ncbi:MAG: hypothetical protein FIA93_06645 [Deltaproteobacteria bacterium]|nr:hypothetical protein [Deltaproteobacteria bacterium]
MEGTRSIQIGHLGERIEASVEISSGEGKMSAVPLVRIKENPVREVAASAENADIPRNALSSLLLDDAISLSRGRKLLDQAKEVFKKLKAEKAESRNPSAPARLAGPVETNVAGAAQDTDEGTGSPGQTINLCDNCNFLLETAAAFH